MHEPPSAHLAMPTAPDAARPRAPRFEPATPAPGRGTGARGHRPGPARRPADPPRLGFWAALRALLALSAAR